jgi:hypothetical protein
VSNHTSCTLVNAGYRKIGGGLYVGPIRPQLRGRAMADEHGLACGERGSVLAIQADDCSEGPASSPLSDFSRQPIRQFSLIGLLKKPNAPASSTHSGHRSRSPLAFI